LQSRNKLYEAVNSHTFLPMLSRNPNRKLYILYQKRRLDVTIMLTCTKHILSYAALDTEPMDYVFNRQHQQEAKRTLPQKIPFILVLFILFAPPSSPSSYLSSNSSSDQNANFSINMSASASSPSLCAWAKARGFPLSQA